MTSIDTTPAELFAAKALASQMKEELIYDILPYWSEKMVRPDGALLGRIDGHDNPDPAAPIGAIMTARVLWTFASAARVTGDASLLEMAHRAKSLIINHFYDKENGGTYWSLTPELEPEDDKKQIYAIAFVIYGLAELYRADGDEQALDYAKRLYADIESHSRDHEKNGYFEAFTRDWGPIADMRLSDKDANESKTMNTHLHILEAYTGLYRVWKDASLAEALRNLIVIFLEKILGADSHLKLFFDDDWNCGYDTVSYGHDIEASWLLYEAAEVLGEEDLLRRVRESVPGIVDAASEGFDPEKGMIYEKYPLRNIVDADRHWWVQAESVVGYFNLWQLSGRQDCIENAVMAWEFIKNNLIDKSCGEWFWSIREDGSINRDDDKAGFWKCPYHNGRMCMEIIERVNNLV